MSHTTYRTHLKSYLTAHANDPLLAQTTTAYARELVILSRLDLTPVEPLLTALYCPVIRTRPRDPLAMFRALLLMLLRRVTGITAWVQTLRGTPFLAVLAGFAPDDVPGVGTFYDVLHRLVNGPYQPPCPHAHRPADDLSHRTIRRLHDATDDRHAYPPIYHSESEALVADLHARADEPLPDTLTTRLAILLVQAGILPTIADGLLDHLDQLAASGDGSALDTDASPHGQRTCDCPPHDPDCDHPRAYTSATAQWSYCPHRDTYVFGDRYYELTTHQHGHDLPLLTILPGGNEADATLSLKALDLFRKLSRDQRLGWRMTTFIGDMHHDTYAHHDDFRDQGITPIVPLRADAKAASLPQLAGQPDLRLDADGTPLCPQGMRMRHHQFAKSDHTHTYSCPAKRLTHRQGQAQYMFHADDCPRHADCCPDSSLGPCVYLKQADDPRLYPPLPRDSKRFQQLYAQRTSTERLNALHDRYRLDRRARNAAYGLIYLTLANILEHAVVRFLEAVTRAGTVPVLLQTTLAALTA